MSGAKADLVFTRNTDVQTGNKPTDRDYDFCRKMGIMTLDSQRRNAGMLDRRDIERNRNNWFKSAGVGY